MSRFGSILVLPGGDVCAGDDTSGLGCRLVHTAYVTTSATTRSRGVFTQMTLRQHFDRTSAMELDRFLGVLHWAPILRTKICNASVKKYCLVENPCWRLRPLARHGTAIAYSITQDTRRVQGERGLRALCKLQGRGA